MPKRTFGQFYKGGIFADVEFQRGFAKTHVTGEHSFTGSGASRPASWTPTGSPEGSAGMPFVSRFPGKARGQAIRRNLRTVGARHRGAPAVGVRPAVRRVFRPQGIGPRTGGFTGIERKFYDTSLVNAALTAPTGAAGGEHDQSATICLNTITQGDGESQRDGRKCTVQSTFVKGVVTVAAQTNITTLDSAAKIYIALVLDTQTNGAQLNSEDVFKNDSGNALLAGSPMRNMQFTQRFRILDTAEFVMQDPNASYDGTNMESQGLVVPFQLSSNMTFSSQYSGTTEDIANITDNSMHIIAYCTSTQLAPSISYNGRVRFVG